MILEDLLRLKQQLDQQATIRFSGIMPKGAIYRLSDDAAHEADRPGGTIMVHTDFEETVRAAVRDGLITAKIAPGASPQPNTRRSPHYVPALTEPLGDNACEDRAPTLVLGDRPQPPIFCERATGHGGWHRNGDMRWLAGEGARTDRFTPDTPVGHLEWRVVTRRGPRREGNVIDQKPGGRLTVAWNDGLTSGITDQHVTEIR